MAADKRVLGMYSNQPGQIAAGDTALVGVGIKQSVAAVQLTIGSGLGDVFIDTGAPGAPGVPSLKKLIVSADMDVNGIETVIGNTIFESNIQLGDAPADYITFVGSVGDPLSANNDIVFEPVNAHQIYVAPPSGAGPGSDLSIGSAAANGAANNAGTMTVDTGLPGANVGTTAYLLLGALNAKSVTVGRTGQTTALNGANQIGGNSTDYTNMVGLIDSNIQFHETGGPGTRAIMVEGNSAGPGDALQITSGSGLNAGDASGSLILDCGPLVGVLSTGDVQLGGAGNATTLAFYTSGTLWMNIDFAGNINVQPGAVLGTIGTGNINLPVNVNAKFQIEGAPISGTNVTAANFDQMWDGSVVPASLHTHAGLAGGTIETTETSLSALDKGMAVRLLNSGGFTRVDKQDATDDTSLNAFTFGLAKATIGVPGPVDIVNFGVCSSLDSAWDVVPAAADIGKPVYGSTTTIGKLSMAPSDSTGWTTRIGYVYFGSTPPVLDTALIFVQPGEVVNNNPP